MQFGSLLLRTDQTKHLNFGGNFRLIHRDGGSFDTQFFYGILSLKIVIGQGFDDS